MQVNRVEHNEVRTMMNDNDGLLMGGVGEEEGAKGSVG